MTVPRRRSFELEGVSHGGAPIPMGACVGNVLFSSGIMGKDPTTDKLPSDAAAQAEFAFGNMKTLVERAGGTLDDVGRITAFVKDDTMRQPLNDAWNKYFPDPESRPARHTLLYDLRGGMLIQLEIIAVLRD